MLGFCDLDCALGGEEEVQVPDFPQFVCTQVGLHKSGVSAIPLGVTTIMRGTRVKRGLIQRVLGGCKRIKSILKDILG